MIDYIESRRLETAIVRLARQRELDGNPFAECVPKVAGRWEEAAIRELALDVRPRPRTADAKELLWKMARAIVLSRSLDLQPTRHSTLEQACYDHLDNIGGHEVPDTRQTWRGDNPSPRFTHERRAGY